jgi:hypothetical protein
MARMSSMNREISSQAGIDQQPQSATGFFKKVFREFTELGSDPDPFQVELLMSEVIGQWWEAEDLSDELIAFAAGKTNPSAAAVLAALRELATTERQRQEAGKALASLTSRGLPEPEWADQLGRFTIGECWRTSDVYGDSSSLLCVFGEGESAHGVLALLDFTEFDGWAKEVAIVDEPDQVLAEMRELAEEEGELLAFEQLSIAEAGRLLQNGLDRTDRIAEPEVSPDFVRFRAVVAARARALQEAGSLRIDASQSASIPDVQVAEHESQGSSEGERQEIVDTFLSQASEITDSPAAREVIKAFIDYGYTHEPTRPLRVGPEKVALILDLLLDGEIPLDHEIPEDFPGIVLAWVKWAGARDGLPQVAIDALVEALENLLEELLSEEEESAEFDPYLDDVDDSLTEEELSELIARRVFAIPSVYTEIGDEELELEPSDEEQRRLLVVGEHPEYHEAIAADELADEPRRHLVVKTTVIDQLWENDPPEVWEVARRMIERGLDREEILSKLAAELTPRLRITDDELWEFDPEEYVLALQEID